MLESKSYAHFFWYCFNFCTPNPVNNLLKRGVEGLAYLFSPEDTTGKVKHRHKDFINSEAHSTRSTIKTVFWIVGSIIFALAVGQLK